MKKVFLVCALLGFTSLAKASDIYNCQYAKAQFSNNAMGKLSYPTPAKVEVDGASIKIFRPDSTFLISPPLEKTNEQLMMVDDGSKVFASALDKSNFAVSDKIAKTTEQWDKCEADENENMKSQVKQDMKRIADIPWGGPEAKKFFLKETHLFMLLECGWAGSVGFSTGSKPIVMLGDSYYPSEKVSFKNGEYSITFNGGSMFVSYNPQKVKGYISDTHSFTPCSTVRLGED